MPNGDWRSQVSEYSEILVEKSMYSWPHFRSTELDALSAQEVAYLTSSLGDYYHTKHFGDPCYIINLYKNGETKEKSLGNNLE